MARILAVDDDPIIQKVLTATLSKAGHTVVVCRNGHELLDIVSREMFDLFIVDANLPSGISGFTVVATLRKDPKFADKPIMFLTGRKEKNDVVRALESGVDDYVVKPIDQSVFLSKVEDLIRSTASRQQHAKIPVSISTNWNVNLDIVGVYEKGIEVHSPIPMAADTLLNFSSQLFSDWGFTSLHFQVVECRQLDSNKKSFAIAMLFVGLSESELQKIRHWILESTQLPAKKVG